MGDNNRCIHSAILSVHRERPLAALIALHLRHDCHYTFFRHDRENNLSERRFTRLASSIRSTARKSARPSPMITSGSGSQRSVHCGGTDHTVAPSPCNNRRLPYRLYRLPTQGSCRPNNGWNGCVTRTNCCAASEMSAFSVEVQAPGPRKVHLALGVGWRGVDLSGPDGLYAGRDRLEKSAIDMATAERRLSEIKYGIMRILGRHKSLNL